MRIKAEAMRMPSGVAIGDRVAEAVASPDWGR
jgi:hypothetical protein